MLPLGSDEATDMAFRSGELLYEQNDGSHDWALTLIISNLFELVASNEDPKSRFESGFNLIMGDAYISELPFGWHPRWVAEAIRNMLDHGLDLTRKQPKNYDGGQRVHVVKIAFIPIEEAQLDNILFGIDHLGGDEFVLMVSPMLYWESVQSWHKERRAK